MKLYLWNDLLWDSKEDEPRAYCPDHRIMLDIEAAYGDIFPQDNPPANDHMYLVCPTDNKKIVRIPAQDYYTLQRRYLAAIQSLDLKDAQIVDIDGYQVPIAKSKATSADGEYWVEARINDTKRGKQLVVYAGKRGAHDKTQVFVDLEHDKITFDQNNMHPNDVFAKLTGEFDSGNKTTMEKISS